MKTARQSRNAPTRTRARAAATLHDNVLGALRDLITEGKFEPGVRLTERVLCARLRVSRTPLREALKVLAHEGLVELLPNCGARVTKLTADDVRHLFDVIGALEALAGRLACEHVTEPELAALEAAHRQMAAHYERCELPAYFRLNQVIHEGIVLAARNPVLALTYATLCGRLRRARYRANEQNEGRWEAAMREHEAIIDALRRRAGDELAEILDAHLHRKYAAICQHL